MENKGSQDKLSRPGETRHRSVEQLLAGSWHRLQRSIRCSMKTFALRCSIFRDGKWLPVVSEIASESMCMQSVA